MEKSSGYSNALPEVPVYGKSHWRKALDRIKKDKIAVLSFGVICSYILVAILASLDVLVPSWKSELGGSYQAPSINSVGELFGTDIFGRSVFYKILHGAKIALSIGFVSTLISIPVGVVLGAVAGYFGGLVDDLIVWFYTTLTSIPDIMLLVAIAFVLGKGETTLLIAIGMTSWVGLARVIRGEFIKHKNREYVLAAKSLGASNVSIIFKHILPNVSHQIIIFFSLLVQGAIKSEVILSYLGLGVQGKPSWGIMIDDAKLELAREVWWQLTGATLAMFALVLSLNLFGDALRDALDPKLKS